MRAERTRHPLDDAVFLDERALRVEVHHVARPVLDRRVAQARAFLDKELDAARVEIRHVVLRRGAALDEVKARALFDDDERVLELPCARRVETEVRLQRDLDRDALRHIDERAARPDRAVERRKLVVVRRHERHEVRFDDVLMLRKRRLHIRVDDALFDEIFLDAVVDDLRIVLRANTRETLLLLRLWDAEAVKRVLDVRRDFLPVARHLRVRADVRDDLVHVEFGDVRSPRRKRERIVGRERLQAEVEHPCRVVLARRNVADDLLREPRFRLVARVVRVLDVVERALDVLDVRFFLLSHPHHSPACAPAICV